MAHWPFKPRPLAGHCLSLLCAFLSFAVLPACTGCSRHIGYSSVSSKTVMSLVLRGLWDGPAAWCVPSLANCWSFFLHSTSFKTTAHLTPCPVLLIAPCFKSPLPYNLFDSAFIHPLCFSLSACAFHGKARWLCFITRTKNDALYAEGAQ